jgi:hypothetical protein
MYTLPIVFRSFEDVTFSEVLNTAGVYVIWDSQAKAKPSYIGKGDLIARMAWHDHNFASPIGGYFGAIEEIGRRWVDDECLIVEALLLKIAEETDRWPNHNRKSGSLSTVERIASKHNGYIKVRVSGHDPFSPPKRSQELNHAKEIRYFDRNGEWWLEYDWKLRKLLKR